MPCLRALPARAVLEGERGSSSVLDTSAAQPAWGGGVLPLPIREAMASGRFTRVPFMQGSNRDEGMFHLTPRYDGGGKPVTAEQYPTILAQFLGPSRVAAVQEQYPLANHASPLQALAAALTDSGTVSNNRVGLCNLHLANQLASPHVALYSYEFADRTAPYPAPIFVAPGTCLVQRTPRSFRTCSTRANVTGSTQDLGRDDGYWTNFAAKGDPNGPGRLRGPLHT